MPDPLSEYEDKMSRWELEFVDADTFKIREVCCYGKYLYTDTDETQAITEYQNNYSGWSGGNLWTLVPTGDSYMIQSELNGHYLYLTGSGGPGRLAIDPVAYPEDSYWNFIVAE